MPNYPIHTLESAPEASKRSLEQLQQAFGVVPNIAGVAATSAKLLNSLAGLFKEVHSSSLSEPEIQVVLLTDAVVNASPYAVAFHTALAQKAGVSSVETDAIRSGDLPSDERFGALSKVARTLIEQRGRLSDLDSRPFFAAGFSEEQLFVVVAILAASTITNYVANIASPPLDDFAANYVWQAPAKAAPASA